ncbi:MAG: hypothetical protein SFW36_00050, partial [Leptolyngbyaceae cyanobacterium bins.59]|nr:hypothetical protein [Leptolyngbyaceae cyanobacterium bins.59]
MLNLRFNLSAFRPLRWLAIAFACVLMVATQVYPAYAVGSKTTQGETQLKNIEAKSFDVLEEGGPYSLEKTSSIANEGINEVQ